MILPFLVIFVLLYIIVMFAYQFMYENFWGVFIGAVVFYIGYLLLSYWFSTRKKVETEEPSPYANDQQYIRLKQFVQKNNKEGFSTKTIKAALLKQGWPQEMVEQAIKEIE